MSAGASADPFNLAADDCNCPQSVQEAEDCQRCGGWAYRCPFFALALPEAPTPAASVHRGWTVYRTVDDRGYFAEQREVAGRVRFGPWTARRQLLEVEQGIDQVLTFGVGGSDPEGAS